jgi:hypothetical protein
LRIIMRGAVAIVLASTLAFSLAACGGDSDDDDDGGTTPSAATSTTSETEEPAETAESSGGYAALDATQQDRIDTHCTWATTAAEAAPGNVEEPTFDESSVQALLAGQYGLDFVDMGEAFEAALDATDDQALIDAAGDIVAECEKVGWTA